MTEAHLLSPFSLPACALLVLPPLPTRQLDDPAEEEEGGRADAATTASN
jgi:hypothetical protein